jgi:hypothetical protein
MTVGRSVIVTLSGIRFHYYWLRCRASRRGRGNPRAGGRRYQVTAERFKWIKSLRLNAGFELFNSMFNRFFHSNVSVKLYLYKTAGAWDTFIISKIFKHIMKTKFNSVLTKRAESSAASSNSCFDSTFEVIGIFPTIETRTILLNCFVSSQPSFEWQEMALSSDSLRRRIDAGGN